MKENTRYYSNSYHPIQPIINRRKRRHINYTKAYVLRQKYGYNFVSCIAVQRMMQAGRKRRA